LVSDLRQVCRLFTRVRAYSNHADSIATSPGRPTVAQNRSRRDPAAPQNCAQNLPICGKNEKGALRLVQSGTNPFIINIFLQNSRRQNAQNEGEFVLFRHKIDLFRPFLEPRGPTKIRLPIWQIPGLFFPLDLCPDPA
jgi:hypothetical protein